MLGVSIDAASAGRPPDRAVQPLPVDSYELPYIVPQKGFEGGDLDWRLTAAWHARDVVLSAHGAAVQAPGASQLRLGRPRVVRVVVTSCDSMDQEWRKRLRTYLAAGVDVRCAPGRAAPFMIVDGQRVGLRVLVAGERRRVRVHEPGQLASLVRRFDALRADGTPVDLDTLLE